MQPRTSRLSYLKKLRFNRVNLGKPASQGPRGEKERDMSFKGTVDRIWARRGRWFAGFLVFFVASRVVTHQYERKKRDEITLGSVLHWRMSGSSVVEAQTSKGKFAQMLEAMQDESTERPKVHSLLALTAAIRAAAHDDRILCLAVDMSSAPGLQDGSTLGLAQAEELREAILAFKEAKTSSFGTQNKYCIAYADTFDSQPLYYLASAFDRVFVQPTGSVPLTGLGTSSLFFKRLLDKAGVEVHAEAREAYKSMVSPFTRRDLSKEQKKDLMDLLDGMNSLMLKGIAQGRVNADSTKEGTEETEGKKEGAILPSRDVKAMTEMFREHTLTGPFTAIRALDAGLVDGLLYPRAVRASIKGQYKFVSMERYMRVRGNEIGTKSKQAGEKPPVLGLVHLLGTIKRGQGQFGANAVKKALVDASADPDIKAIVLRIDSPGGDVLASDTVAEAIDYCQTERGIPVIASFGNVSASGGYYISTHCHKIFAQPLTITGSIGVAALRPYLSEKFLDKTGLDVEKNFTGSRMQSPFEALTGEALKRFKGDTDSMYEIFLDRVVQGRRLPLEKVRELAGGRVWSGLGALEGGLVDRMGGVRDALMYAALELPLDQAPNGRKPMFPSGLDQIVRPYEVREYPRKLTLMERIRQGEAAEAAEEGARAVIGWVGQSMLRWAMHEGRADMGSALEDLTHERSEMEMMETLRVE